PAGHPSTSTSSCGSSAPANTPSKPHNVSASPSKASREPPAETAATTSSPAPPPTKRQPHDRPLRPLPVRWLRRMPAPRRHRHRTTTKGGLSIGAHPDDQTELLHLAHDRRPHTHPAPHLHRPLDPRRRRRALHLRPPPHPRRTLADRKSTRLNSSHVKSSYAAICLNTNID